MGRWRGCWGLWPLLALGPLIFAVWEVAKHIHIEQEGILLQATDLRVQVFTPSNFGDSPRDRDPSLQTRVHMPCPAWVLGHRCVLCVSVSVGPLGPVTRTSASSADNRLLGWEAEEELEPPCGPEASLATMGGGTSGGGQDVQPR